MPAHKKENRSEVVCGIGGSVIPGVKAAIMEEAAKQKVTTSRLVGDIITAWVVEQRLTIPVLEVKPKLVLLLKRDKKRV